MKQFIFNFLAKYKWPLVLCLLTIIIGWTSLVKPMNSEVDSYSHYLMALAFLEKGANVAYIMGSVWLPLHAIFISLPMTLFTDGTFGARLATLLISSLIPVLLYVLTLKLTRHQLISVIVGLVCVIHPFFRHLSTVTLTEPLFLVLFLASQIFLLQERYGWFIVGIFFSQATRFEAWFLIPWYLLILWIPKKLSLKKKLLLSFMLVIFPILQSLASLRNNHTPVYYYQEMAELVKIKQADGVHNFPVAMDSWNKKIWEATPFVFILLTAVGIYAFRQIKSNTASSSTVKQLVYVISPVFLVFMLYVQVFLRLRDWLPFRYIFIPTVLALPIMGLGVQWLLKRLPIKRYWLYFIFLSLFLFFELYSLNLNSGRMFEAYNSDLFNQQRETLIKLKESELLTDSSNVYLLVDLHAESSLLSESFVRYFLLSKQPKVIVIDPIDLTDQLATAQPGDFLLIQKNYTGAMPKNLQLFYTTDFYTTYQVKTN
jgi:hypothetical protein